MAPRKGSAKNKGSQSHSHRSILTQKHKAFKKSGTKPKQHGGGRKGPVSGTSNPGAHTAAIGKADRLLQGKQRREKRKEDAERNRRMGAPIGQQPPPKIVAIVPLRRGLNTTAWKDKLAALAGEENSVNIPGKPITITLPPSTQMAREGRKQRLCLIDADPYAFCSTADGDDLNNDKPQNSSDDGEASAMQSSAISHAAQLHLLDVLKVANVVVVLLPATASIEEPPFDDLGYAWMSLMRQQGLPTVVGISTSLTKAGYSETSTGDMLDDERQFTDLQPNKQKSLRKLVQRYFYSEFGEDSKFVPCENASEAQVQSLLRTLSIAEPKDFVWRGQTRGYLLAEEVVPILSENAVEFRGYARGIGFTVKHPIHLTGVGDFIVQSIVVKERKRGQDDEEKVVETLTKEIGDTLHESWDRLAPYDPFSGEQTFPTEAELADAAAAAAASRKKRFIASPEGTSGYQRSWYAEEEGNIETEEAQENKDMLDEENDDCYSYGEEEDDGDDVDFREASAEETSAEMARAKKIQLEERSREDMEFPDEVDTPLDQPARTRFARYRALRSFRTSEWDRYEELPTEYSRVFEYDSFRSSVNHAHLTFASDALPLTGQFVHLRCHLSGPDGDLTAPETQTKIAKLEKRLAPLLSGEITSQPASPFIISTLLPYERKVAVRAFKLSRVSDSSNPLKSKDPLIFQVGFRRFEVRPIYSESPMIEKGANLNKLKFERFFRSNASVTATCYCPTVIPPANVLAFRLSSETDSDDRSGGITETVPKSQRVAVGTVSNMDSRLPIIKRVALSGYPFRVHKRKAVVRFMFFNADDVRWFRPAELRTKRNLRGTIKEPLGTHGYMKCYFNDFITHADTVLLYLYKRVFPKWHESTWLESAD